MITQMKINIFIFFILYNFNNISHANEIENFLNDQQAMSYYMEVARSNDIFVFCTQGVPLHNWTPINPILGTWKCTTKCKYVNWQWIPAYQYICPKGIRQGKWVGPNTGDKYKAASKPGKPQPPQLEIYKH